jgi:hypothetical protein
MEEGEREKVAVSKKNKRRKREEGGRWWRDKSEMRDKIQFGIFKGPICGISPQVAQNLKILPGKFYYQNGPNKSEPDFTNIPPLKMVHPEPWQ